MKTFMCMAVYWILMEVGIWEQMGWVWHGLFYLYGIHAMIQDWRDFWKT